MSFLSNDGLDNNVLKELLENGFDFEDRDELIDRYFGGIMKEAFIYNAQLDRVIDGDTVDAWVDLGFKIKIKKRIRLMGLDTWESRTRDLDEKAKGMIAKAFTLTFLAGDGGNFKVQSHGLGKYGRLLGEIWVNDISLNNELLSNGHAYEYDGGKKKTFKKKGE
tara:strand:- start:8626 stop:9117 length:492 start_codon:yes stop_codon:yes gene_type:complete